MARLGLGIAAMAGTLTFAPEHASAHLWYPKECCNEQDCFRAIRVKHLADGSLYFETGHAGEILVIVPPQFERMLSQDRDYHVCVYRDAQGKYHPRCVFVPGLS